ncbi:hypothetical protein [uncultured Helicobacter sp.]|uniref:hypothetical protein n=1 Tax=uncultured Helicobacter sp. TaxID=175537 RepID=UPI00259A3FD4|nr:hypothetical protein [uncultured Helicobacter sp.]
MLDDMVDDVVLEEEELYLELCCRSTPPPTEIFEVLMLYLMLHSLSLTKIKACIISESSLIFTCLARANCFHFVFYLMRDF